MNEILLYWIVPFLIPVGIHPTDPSVRDQHVLRIDECGNIPNRAIHTLLILSDTPTIFVKKHDQQPTTIDYNKLKPYFGWVNVKTIKKNL